MRSARTERFLAEMPPEPVSPVGATIRCAAGLAILTLLVTIGDGTSDLRTFARSGPYAAGTTMAPGEGAHAAT